MSELDRLAGDSVRRHELPGVAVAVVRAGQVVASAAAGFADLANRTLLPADGVCNWFSMTKIATGNWDSLIRISSRTARTRARICFHSGRQRLQPLGQHRAGALARLPPAA